MQRLATLWIGRRLSFIDLLCLRSMYDLGQKPILYAYDEIENAPDYVDLADAREILPNDDFIFHREKNSPAIHSDIFRVNLCSKTPHIWVDTDAYLYRPLEPVNGYLVGRLNDESVLTGVFRLPQSSPSLKAMSDFLNGDFRLPAWWSEEEKRNAADARSFGDLKWGTTGPNALSHFMTENGEMRHAVGPKVLYPVRSRAIVKVCRAPRWVMLDVDASTVSLHLYRSFLRMILLRRGEGSGPRQASYLGQLCHKHGIDPADAPLA